MRGWLRRFAARANQTASHAVACIYRFDLSVFRVAPADGNTPVQFALAALGRAAAAAEHALEARAVSGWQLVTRCARDGCWPTRAALPAAVVS